MYWKRRDEFKNTVKKKSKSESVSNCGWKYIYIYIYIYYLFLSLNEQNVTHDKKITDKLKGLENDKIKLIN